MKQVVIFVILFGVALAGRLDNQYLPSNRQYLAPPLEYSNPQISSLNRGYLAPSSQIAIARQSLLTATKSVASTQYLAPISQNDALNRQYLTPNTRSTSSSNYNQVPILRLENKPNNGDGSYSYEYQTADGINAQEGGKINAKQGGFSYTSPEGEQVSLQYTADENGFRPQGSHIPISPPVPEGIQRSIQLNLAASRSGYQQESHNKGSNQEASVQSTYESGGYRY